MSRISLSYIVFLCLSLLVISCSPGWTEALRKGEVQEEIFHTDVDIEVKSGLLIIPVTIGNKDYRFIFDSGAPTSISNKIQAEFNFKTLLKSNIVDSEKNRKKVSYVSIDTIFINNTPFLNQTAFVGDFESNPVIKCIGVDGIIGSNLMRFCNWTIDAEKRNISFFNHPVEEDSINTIKVPFTVNSQFDMLVDIKIGKAKVKNIKVDYGSNGDLSLPSSAFSKLDNEEILDNKFDVIGYTQAGLLGEVNERKYVISYVDSLYLGDCLFENVKMKSKGSGLLGNHLLSEYIVSIDWHNKLLHFKENTNTVRSTATFGLSLGKDDEENALYIQSVVVNSVAYKNGLRPLMKVRKVDSLDFSNGSTYCDYVEAMNYNTGPLYLEYKVENEEWQKISIEKEYLGNE